MFQNGNPKHTSRTVIPPGYGERVRGLKNASQLIRDYLGDNSAYYYSTLSRLIAAGEISALNADDKGGSRGRAYVFSTRQLLHEIDQREGIAQ